MVFLEVIMNLTVELKERSYPIVIERGCTSVLKNFINTKIKSFVISDAGVPEKWKRQIMNQLEDAVLFVVPQGEQAKSFAWYEACLKEMLKQGFHRNDQVVALGGGVVGDLAGFVAASYMRGIDFIQIPTTTLSQIDSSIGGKVALNVDGIKNCVGAFWQPKAVLIDINLLSTLPERHLSNGLIEALKAGCIQDKELFEIIEQKNIYTHLEEIIIRSLLMKKRIVEQDETEQGIRKILNFGHTIGHAIESFKSPEYLHGEAVGLGMLMMCEDETIRSRIRNCLLKLNAPIECEVEPLELLDVMMMDKKAHHSGIHVITVKQIGSAEIEKRTFDEMKEWLSRRERT